LILEYLLNPTRRLKNTTFSIPLRLFFAREGAARVPDGKCPLRCLVQPAAPSADRLVPCCCPVRALSLFSSLPLLSLLTPPPHLATSPSQLPRPRAARPPTPHRRGPALPGLPRRLASRTAGRPPRRRPPPGLARRPTSRGAGRGPARHAPVRRGAGRRRSSNSTGNRAVPRADLVSSLASSTSAGTCALRCVIDRRRHLLPPPRRRPQPAPTQIQIKEKKSVTILLCGTSGCGKSTLSSLMAVSCLFTATVQEAKQATCKSEEVIHPDDAFGEQMIRNLELAGSLAIFRASAPRFAGTRLLLLHDPAAGPELRLILYSGLLLASSRISAIGPSCRFAVGPTDF
ncbi:hypothetical protein U9M48_001472, partial [Paspalum notatum var. saurae]